jgi:hypothetical protein
MQLWPPNPRALSAEGAARLQAAGRLWASGPAVAAPKARTRPEAEIGAALKRQTATKYWQYPQLNLAKVHMYLLSRKGT